MLRGALLVSAASVTGVLALAGVGAGAGGFAAPAQLPKPPGWHVGSARLQDAGCARCVQTESWASTVPYRDPPNQLPPWKTLAALRPAGLVVHVTRSWQPAEPAWALRKRPLRIVRTQIHANFEGNTAPDRVSLWNASTWRNGSYVTVWVFFGSPHPGSRLIARAQAEIDRVKLAAWHVR
jgi:hypothetical protein